MLTLAVKALHVLSTVLFLGAGLMTAYYKVRSALVGTSSREEGSA